MSALEPNFLVLLAFGADANDPDPAFTDVSADLLAVESINRGSPSDLDRNNPGTATFVLDNYSGAYDNENADSPYVGDLVPMTQVLIYAEYDGELYPRFRGFLDAVQLDYPGEGVATATFTATDGFKPLAQTALPSSAYVAEVMADEPAAFWRLGEPDGSTVVFDSSGSFDLDVSGSPDFGQTGLVARESGSAILTTSGASQKVGRYYVGSLPASGAPITLETVFRRTVDGADGGMGGIMCDPLTHGMFALLTSSTVVAAQAVNGANTQTLAFTTGVDLDDNLTHHIVARWAADGSIKIFVDGVDRTSGSPTCAATAFTDTSAFVFANGFFGDPDTGVQQMCAIYDTALSDARIAAHAAAVSTPWNGDTPAERAGRVCDLAEWPDGLRDFDTGDSTLQSADLDMASLEHLQKVAESEFGELFVALDGTLTLRERAARINRPSLATFGDADGEVGYRSITFDSSDELLRNPVTVSRAEGVAQTVEDATNVARYYPHQYTLDGLYHDDDELSRSAAQFFVSEYKDPKRRITGLSFGPAEAERIDDWYPLLLTAELGGRYDVVFRPPNVTLPFEQTSVLEGTSESWTPAGGHVVSWSLTPAYAGDFLELDAGPDKDGLDSARLYF